MKKITIVDTSIATRNLGDQIIMRSVIAELRNLLPGAFLMHVPSHEYITEESYKLLAQSDAAVVGGTNLLSSNMNAYNQWKISWRDYFKMSNVLLLGVGWWQYQDSPNWYTKKLFGKVLGHEGTHSVRDRYTLYKMQEMGFRNVANTSCPTTWSLTGEHCATIPEEKGESVVMTITDYNPNPEKDRYLWEILRRSYERVYLWIQGSGDYAYARSIYGDQIEYVDPSLDAFEELLSSQENLDYVGTRLHAGIFALKHRRRSIIVGIDNRAAEISKDLGLSVVNRNALPELKQLIKEPLKVAIELPQAEINRWKEDFLSLVGT